MRLVCLNNVDLSTIIFRNISVSQRRDSAINSQACASVDLPQVSLEWILIGSIQFIMRSVSVSSLNWFKFKTIRARRGASLARQRNYNHGNEFVNY